jgi:hypothetical protein
MGAPYGALGRFSDRTLFGKYEATEAENREISKKVSMLDKAINETNTMAIYDAEKREAHVRELMNLSNEKRLAEKRLERLNADHPHLWDSLRRDICEKQRSGILIAEAFFGQHTPGTPPLTIPADEWRFLILDEEDENALGPNFEYIALRIGKPH